MEKLITGIIEQYGYLGILILITLENIFPPIPSEVILTFGGFITTTTSLSAIGVISVSTIGSVAGAIILYSIGQIVDINRAEKFIEKWGHFFRLTKKDIHKANFWFLKYGVWTVFFCRFIPLIRSLISIPAGMVRMNFGLFLLFTALGTLIWNTALVLIGIKVGESWENVVGYFNVYSSIVYGLLILLVVLFLLSVINKQLKLKKVKHTLKRKP